MPAPLMTERLALHRQRRKDIDDYVALDMIPAVRRYLLPLEPPPAAERRQELTDRFDRGWPEPGAMWTVTDRGDNRFVGWCGIFPLEQSGLMEIGYRYRPKAWGRGIATEAARAVLEQGFGVLGIDPIVAVAHPENIASHRVLEKIGLQRQGVRHHYGLDLAFFQIDRQRS